MTVFSEAVSFFSSFKNPDTQGFVKDLMKKNYAAAVLEHHPAPNRLQRTDIQDKCNMLIGHIFDRINALENPRDLFSLFSTLSRNSNERENIWFEEFMEAYENYKHRTKLKNRYQQLRPFITGPSYCDVGCGGGDLVAHMKKCHSNVVESAGIDVLDWRSDSVKDIINFQMLDMTQPGVSSRKAYDTITCLAVLHHIDKRDGGLECFLKNLKTALNPGGRLVVEEDVILPEEQIDAEDSIKEQIGRRRHQQPFFDTFLHFDQDTQRDIITIIDFLSNSLAVGVPDMPFPCSFHTLAEWKHLFRETGFAIYDIKIEGFVSSRFNQSSHVIFVLE